MTDAALTSGAADLAERILEEVTKLDHDWEAIGRWARELAELGERAAAAHPQARTAGHATAHESPGLRHLPSHAERARTAASLAALGHSTRLLILEALAREDALSPAEIAELEPQTTLPVVAYHARELRDHGLIRHAGRRQVRGAVQHFYALSPRGRELLELARRPAWAAKPRGRPRRRGSGRT